MGRKDIAVLLLLLQVWGFASAAAKFQVVEIAADPPLEFAEEDTQPRYVVGFAMPGMKQWDVLSIAELIFGLI
jgi:hypothetical protein